MDDREMRERLQLLQAEHRALDSVLVEHGDSQDVFGFGAGLAMNDSVARMRTKKHKLRLRDEIAVLESMLIPDILA